MNISQFQSHNTLVVFSHPNHELAVYGFMQRVRPWSVYLTDGGGNERVEQTRRGLSRIGLVEKATFLNHSEASFYQALVDCDSAFFQRVADQVGDVIAAVFPENVLCDAVEFYNPVHDLSLPIVRSAMKRSSGISAYEIPLIYQKPSPTETYQIQRMPPSRQTDCVSFDLSDQELEMKRDARDQVYTILRDDLGPLLTSGFSSFAGTEFVAASHQSLPVPSAERTLRYHWRAELLRSQGAIQTPITYEKNYLATVQAL